MRKRPIDLGLVAKGDRILRDARKKDPAALADAVEKAIRDGAVAEIVAETQEQTTAEGEEEGMEE